MKKVLSNRTFRAITFSFIFLISGIGASILVPASAATNGPTPASMAAALPGAALTQAQANWQYPNGNAFNQDYNPISQINASSAPYMGLSWLYPLPNKPNSLIPASASGGVGVNMQVLLVNGTAYGTTNFDQVLAWNVANGNLLWTFTVPLNVNQTFKGIVGALSLHHHDGHEWFTTATFASGVSGPTLWISAQNHAVYAINAISGKQELNFTTFPDLSLVPGNSPTSKYASAVANVVIDQQKGILVTAEMCETRANCGRGFFTGWDLNVSPPKLIWLTFTTPPQPGGNLPVDPNWSIKSVQNMTRGASIFFPGKGSPNGYNNPTELQGGVMMNTNDNIVVNLKTLSPSQLNATLYNDWGQAQQSAQCLGITGGGSTGTTGAAWGGPWVLGSGPTKGVVFAASNNKDPYVSPCTPGPDLWSASVFALNITTGKFVWGFQTLAHDLWDWDCSWWQAAGNETINGVNTPVLFKTCKSGFLWEINALTGSLIWAWSPPTNIIPRCSVCWPWDPTNKTQMSFDFPTAMNTFKTQPTTGAQPSFLQFPGTPAGFESEQSYNPATNTVFAASHDLPYFITYLGLNASTYFTSPGESFTPINNPKFGGIPSNNNSTIWSINGLTGAINWHYFIPLQGFRGAVTLAGTMVLSTLSSGDLLMLDQATGKLIRDYYVGAPMDVAASVGASSQGQEFIIIPVGTCSFVAPVTCPGTTPGDIVALSLQNVPTALVTTVTSVSTTTAPAATTGASTVTTTVAGSVTTVSGGGGIDPTVTYGIAAVAVIFIIATGFLAMRGRKPAT